MSMESDLRSRLTAAIRAKDLRTANLIRMINTKVMEVRTAEGFSGEVDDDLYLDVIAKYKKSLDKAIKQYAAAGDKGAEHVAELTFETDYLAQFLPEKLGPDQVRELVKAAIAELGVTDPKMAGRVVGAVMKKHSGDVDASLVKQIASEELGG